MIRRKETNTQATTNDDEIILVSFEGRIRFGEVRTVPLPLVQ